MVLVQQAFGEHLMCDVLDKGCGYIKQFVIM